MSDTDKQALLAELARRLIPLRTVALPTKALVLSYADKQMSASDIRTYLDDRLSVVERYVETVDHRDFLAAIVRLGSIQGFQELAEELGVSPPDDDIFWLRWAYRLQYSTPQCVFALANHWAMPLLPEPNTDVQGLTLLFACLALLERYADCVEALEARIGLCSGAYDDPVALAAAIRPFLDELEPNNSANFIQSLADRLGFVGRSADGTAVLEARIGLRPGEYDDPVALAVAIKPFLEELQPNHSAIFIKSLAERLAFGGRDADGAAVMEARIGLRRGAYDDPDSLAAVLRPSLGELEPNNSANFIRSLADSLGFVGRDADGMAALEAWIGLRPGDYDDTDSLVATIKPFLNEVDPNNSASFIQSLADRLGSMGRSADGVAVLEAWIGLRPKAYDDPAAIAAAIRPFLDALTSNNSATFIQSLADRLGFVGRHADSVAALEARIGLRPGDYDHPDSLAAAITPFLDEVQPNNSAIFIQSLADRLESVGRDVDGVAALEAIVAAIPWLDPEGRQPLPENGVNLLERWLRVVGKSRERFEDCCQLCDLALRYLKQGLHRFGMRLEDRRRYVDRLAAFRREVRTFVERWIDSAAVGADFARRGFRWQAELGQRMLLERFLLGRAFRAGDDGASFTDSLAVGIRPYRSERPRILFGHSSNAAFSGADTIQSRSSVQEEPQLRIDFEIYDGAAQLAAPTLTDEELADRVGVGGMLLHLYPDAEGAIRWAAFSSDGRLLQPLSAGRGSEGDRLHLVRASAEHDLRIDMAYLAWNRRGTAIQLAKEFQRRVPALVAAEDETLLELANSLFERFAEQGCPGFGLRLGRMLVSLLPAENATHWLVGFTNTLLADANATRSGGDFDVRIDGITADLVSAVSAAIDLKALEPHLAPDVDVTLMAEDVLLALPLDLLPVGGKALFARVASMRQMLSPLLERMQKLYEDQSVGESPARDLLAFSWFDRTDEAPFAGSWLLHDGHLELAKRHADRRLFAAAESPAGSARLLQASLAQGRFDLATILGHGDTVNGGLELADGRWLGTGALHRIVNLLLPSCSQGRLNHSGLRDVEGFLVELTANGARSVVACSWPVHCFETPAFVNRVAEEYLALPFDSHARRARALNAARKHFLDDAGRRRPGAAAGLNTIAAHQQWGLA